ncbi:MAG TPA: type II secretion system F family protein [Acidimicrobiales bacterium]|nr:type II secretion system F family protein [Acidimicrobiales bacterium]
MTGVVLGLAVGLLVLGGWPGRTRRPPGVVRSPRREGALERWLAPRLTAADLDWPASVVTPAWAAAVAGVVLAGVLGGGPVLGLLGLVVAVVVPLFVLSGARGRRDDRLARELPALLESVARSLRSGASIPAALREAAAGGSAAAQDLAEVIAHADRGVPLTDALARWTAWRPIPGVRLVVGVLTVALGSGGTPARAVDGVASTLRERAEVDRELRALATQARTSAIVVTLAPLAFAALGVLGDERTATFLLRTPTGLVCLAVGVALDGFGAWWMTRIAASAS